MDRVIRVGATSGQISLCKDWRGSLFPVDSRLIHRHGTWPRAQDEAALPQRLSRTASAIQGLVSTQPLAPWLSEDRPNAVMPLEVTKGPSHPGCHLNHATAP